MCEILIQLNDKVPASDPLYDKNYRAGDVISLVPDGWEWSTRELTNPDWRIIKLPGEAVDKWKYLTNLLTSPTGEPTGKRNSFLDGGKLPGPVKNDLKNNQVLTLTPQQIVLVENWITSRT